MKKILIVTSYNSGRISPFVKDQVESLREKSLLIDYFKIVGKGALGYLKNYKKLKEQVNTNEYDLVHAHYGLSGLLANMQRIVPVITTFHGSDTHFKKNRILSFISSRLSAHNILTNKKQIRQLRLKKFYTLQSCGVDLSIFKPQNRVECRKYFDFKANEKIVLFASSFDRVVKQPELAKRAISKTDNVKLIELKGYSKKEVSLLINASDMVLITSKYETGPLIAKEALACNIPVVSTDVGDVRELIQDVDNCYITKHDHTDIAEKVNKVLNSTTKCMGRSEVVKFDLSNVAENIIKVYKKVLNV